MSASLTSSGETPRIVILADDLSGAADSAVAFASRGMRTRVSLGRFDWADADILAVDLDTRRQKADAAATAIHRGWTQAQSSSAQLIFKKIDSKLRGHIHDELLALSACVDPGTAFLVCPAHPAAGVRYRSGQGWQDANPIRFAGESTSYRALHKAWMAHGLATATSGEGGQSSDCRHWIDTAPSEASHPALVLVNAEHEQELDDLVRCALDSRRPVMLVGSGGLTAALARRLDKGARLPWRAAPANARAVVIAGSVSAVTRRQLEDLRDAGLGRVHWITPSGLRAGSRPKQIEADLAIAAVALGGTEDQRPRQAQRVLEGFVATCTELARNADALVLTGGETARGILEALDVHALEILLELAPGVVVSNAIGSWRGRVVTKSGSFGDAAALTDALRFLRNQERMDE